MNTNRPVLFVPHGSPMFALQPGAAGAAMTQLVGQLDPPRAIVVVSPHWETAVPTVGTARQLETIHDFGGFDPRLFEIQYPATGCPQAAQQVVAALQAAGLPVATDARRGLDHGAWVPLKVMYPDASIPVLQLSLPSNDPRHLVQLGNALRSLRDEGILVIGSGFMTHGLPYLTPEMFFGSEVPGWSQEFDAWAAEALERGDLDELAAFRCKAPGLPFAHPTVEHFTPLFVTLGAADGAPETVIDGYAFGLSKRSLQVS